MAGAVCEAGALHKFPGVQPIRDQDGHDFACGASRDAEPHPHHSVHAARAAIALYREGNRGDASGGEGCGAPHDQHCGAGGFGRHEFEARRRGGNGRGGCNAERLQHAARRVLAPSIHYPTRQDALDNARVRVVPPEARARMGADSGHGHRARETLGNARGGDSVRGREQDLAAGTDGAQSPDQRRPAGLPCQPRSDPRSDQATRLAIQGVAPRPQRFSRAPERVSRTSLPESVPELDAPLPRRPHHSTDVEDDHDGAHDRARGGKPDRGAQGALREPLLQTLLRVGTDAAAEAGGGAHPLNVARGGAADVDARLRGAAELAALAPHLALLRGRRGDLRGAVSARAGRAPVLLQALADIGARAARRQVQDRVPGELRPIPLPLLARHGPGILPALSEADPELLPRQGRIHHPGGRRAGRPESGVPARHAPPRTRAPGGGSVRVQERLKAHLLNGRGEHAARGVRPVLGARNHPLTRAPHLPTPGHPAVAVQDRRRVPRERPRVAGRVAPAVPRRARAGEVAVRAHLAGPWKTERRGQQGDGGVGAGAAEAGGDRAQGPLPLVGGVPGDVHARGGRDRGRPGPAPARRRARHPIAVGEPGGAAARRDHHPIHARPHVHVGLPLRRRDLPAAERQPGGPARRRPRRRPRLLQQGDRGVHIGGLHLVCRRGWQGQALGGGPEHRDARHGRVLRALPVHHIGAL
mmetsp:Transcript_47338/g.112690  ORF Transcript_47338/g.112690 Transcript_47338/m.112690 type:complete len:700 (+) Transcript_47338:725-2824(+)